MELGMNEHLTFTSIAIELHSKLHRIEQFPPFDYYGVDDRDSEMV
jgi:hypothetical protein